MVSFAEAEAFFRAYALAVHEEQEAYMTEPDNDAYQAKVRALLAVHAPGMHLNRIRPEFNDDFRTSQAKQREYLVARTIFQIKAYDDSQHGQLFTAYTGGNDTRLRGNMRYSELWVAAPIEGELKLLGRGHCCIDCDLTGEIEGRTCPSCKGYGWEYIGCPPQKPEGKPTKVEKYQPPKGRVFLADYESDD